MTQLCSENMKCDERSARHSYKGTIASIVGAAVGAVVSGFSYVLTSGGEIDGVELAKSCLSPMFF